MAKLIFYYGTVCSSKSAQLLLMSHNYESCGMNVVTIKPALDTRSEMIETRAKVPPRKADIIINSDESLLSYSNILITADVIMIDECQFMTVEQINELRDISTDSDINVLCFGLRTDYNTNLFPASKRLFELADEINEVKTVCSVCGKHASFNAKVTMEDDGQLILPGWENFKQMCHLHYRNNKK